MVHYEVFPTWSFDWSPVGTQRALLANMRIEAENEYPTPGTQALEKGGFYVQWHFLEGCNLRCRHCYQESYEDSMLEDGDLLAIADSLDTAMQRWNRVGRVSLTGGEPFMVPRQLSLLMARFEASPYFESIGILTNGTLVDSDIVESVRRHKKVREVQVSLDGATANTHDAIRGKGSFSRAIEGVERLRAGGIRVAIMFTLTRRNQHEALEIIDVAGRLGCICLLYTSDAADE